MKILGRRPTVPEYFQEYINHSINLLDEPKQCCPFHSENTPSFSYNIETGRWSCFGACHAHGDVVEMHKRNFKFSTREEAARSLDALYEVAKPSSLKSLNSLAIVSVSQENVDDKVTYEEACMLANTPDRWLELDYVMSMIPVERWRLTELINKWKGI